MCSGRGDGQLRPPGFPIRKSPDHSLVADSPGLIAGSNVLHRLLVPRHPPCALINLATTYRCSRPLCSSQGTGGPGGRAPVRALPPVLTEGAASGRSLRTQQRARPDQSLASAFLRASGVLTGPGSCSDRITSAPLVSCHLGTCARDMALDATDVRGSARCSLERR